METTPRIILKDAAFGYTKNGQDQLVLEDISFSIRAGEFTGIVGLNGVGKSTFLRTLSGLLPLKHGEFILNNRSIHSYSTNELAREIAIVLTERVGGFNLSTFDAVAAGQMPYTDAFNRLKPENKTVINEAMRQCGITNHAHKALTELSDGMFQKTMIAKALAQQTPVLLLDEPSAFLDYASKHELFILLKKLATEDKKTVLVSSHDLDLVLKYCSRILVFSDRHAELLDVSQAKQHPGFLNIGGGHI